MNGLSGPWKAENGIIKALAHGKWFTIAVVDKKKFNPHGRQEIAELMAASDDLLTFARSIEKVLVSSGHNMLSTASEEKKNSFISQIIDAWNAHYSVLDKLEGK